MNNSQKFVLKSQYKPNCYVLVSPCLKDSDRPKDIDNMNYHMSFVYDNPETGYAAEWEPKYGPIQTWHKCESDAENASEHYFFDFVDNRNGMNWAQGAVEHEGFHYAFYDSEWDRIFEMLKGWTYR